MSKDIVSARLGSTLKEVSELLIKNRIRAVLVRDDRGNPWGVISTRDIVGSMARADFNSLTAEEVISRDLITIRPESTLKEAAAKMIEHHVQRLIVAHPSDLKGRLTIVGIITMTDLIRTVSEK